MITTTVVIVNYNGGDLLQRCLDHVSIQTLQPTHVVVVDNGSSDGSVSSLKEMPNLTVHYTGNNLGFAGGNNWFLSQCDTDLVVLLNPDAFPEPDWLANLLEAARKHPDVAAFGSVQILYGSNSLIDGFGDVYHASGLVWRRGHGQQFLDFEKISCDIFSPCACAALYRREIINDVGGFDEDFFCYIEDVDLGFRLRLAGHKAMLVPDAVVHHHGSATTGGQHSNFSVYHGHRNIVWAYVKNMPGWLFWLFFPLHVSMNIAVIAWFVVRGQGKVILKAKRDAILGLPRMWSKRIIIQGERRVSTMSIWKALDMRFLVGKLL